MDFGGPAEGNGRGMTSRENLKLTAKLMALVVALFAACVWHFSDAYDSMVEVNMTALYATLSYSPVILCFLSVGFWNKYTWNAYFWKFLAVFLITGHLLFLVYAYFYAGDALDFQEFSAEMFKLYRDPVRIGLGAIAVAHIFHYSIIKIIIWDEKLKSRSGKRN